jgi:hypothetical protein
MNHMQPGQVIAPHSSSEEPQPGQQPSQPQPSGQPTPERPTETPEPTPTPFPEPEQDARSLLSPRTDSAMQMGSMPADISWTAAEFVEHEKTASWYAALAAVTVVIAVAVYFVTKDKISTGTIVAVLIGFGLFAARKPQMQAYRLSSNGIQVGGKVYGFYDYKAFSVTEDGAVISVVLSPLRRFMPPLTIYVAPEVEESVVAFLGMFMPFEQHRADAVDNLMRKIRF